MLLDVYGHFMPTETGGFADALASPDGPHAAPRVATGSTPPLRSDIKLPESKEKTGADERTRTADLLITNQQEPPTRFPTSLA